MEIVHEIISAFILSLQLIQEKTVVDFWQKCVHKVNVTRLEDLAA